jgi:hypothetical protein
MQRMGVQPEDLRSPGEQLAESPVSCPCLWTEAAGGVRPLSLHNYNNENRWYVEKYQAVLGLFE